MEKLSVGKGMAENPDRPLRFNPIIGVLRYGIYVAFFLLCIILALISPNFLTLENIMNVLLQSSVIGVIAVGMTFVIITRGIDVSVGSAVAVSSAVSVMLMLFHGVNQYLGLLIMVLVSTLIGLGNGLAVSKLRMPAFIVTLAAMQIFRGLTLAISLGRSYYTLPPVFKFIGFTYIGPVPITVIIAVLAFIVGHILLSHTVFGQKVYAVGSNPEAARVSGINVNRILVSVFLICGVFTGLGSVLLTARLNSFWPTMGTGFEFDAIASVVIGGTSLFGGQGWIGGTAVGVLIMGVVNNALNLLNVSAYYQQVAKGAIIFLAVLIDTLKNFMYQER